MSVVVLGMDMPNNCCDCPLFKSNASGYLFCKGKRISFGKEDAEWLPKTTPNWCPLRPLPEHHGRLIDGDELSDGCDAPHWCRWKSEIDDMPTIIEKESE